MIRRSDAVVDWYRDGEAGAVLLENEVLVLAPLPSLVMDLLMERQQTLDSLTARLVERFGHPGGDPVELTRQVVSEMESRGLVRVGRDG